MNRSLARRRQRGFTLIEMMVVVAIIGILAAFVFSVATKPYGANAKTTAEEVVSIVNFAKLRAQVTRKVHRVQVEPQLVSLWELSVTGLKIPTSPVWTLVQTKTLRVPVTIHNVTASAVTATGVTVTQNSSLLYTLDVRPDGQATASTIYITDGSRKWRVLTYHATGGTYARELW